MPRTFEQSEDDQANKSEQERERSPSQFEVTTPKTFGGESLSGKFDTLATFLTLPGTQENVGLGAGNSKRYRQITDQVRVDLSNQLGVNLNNLGSALDNLANQDLSNASTNTILANIANTLHVASKYMQIQSETQVQQLSSLVQIMNSVSAPTAITVSGTNALNDPDTPEPVVPQSKSQSIPTRTLYVRADPSNNVPLYFGDDNTDPESGFRLNAGESMTFEFDLRDNVLYYAASEADQVVDLMGVF